jgi:hypothetical protein
MSPLTFPFVAAAALVLALPAQGAPAIQPAQIMMINMGGSDCPPCLAWRRAELPKLQAMEVFKSITFVHVEKGIQGTVPPRFFLPSEVRPLKEKLDFASGGMSGSPQVAFIVNGEVYDYYFGTRPAPDIEKMIRSILDGTPYPFQRCVQRDRRKHCVVTGM